MLYKHYILQLNKEYYPKTEQTLIAECATKEEIIEYLNSYKLEFIKTQEKLSIEKDTDTEFEAIFVNGKIRLKVSD